MSKGQLPEVVSRHPPDVQLGMELILLEAPPIMSTSLIDSDGAAHLFLIDEERQLNHIEIFGDKIITSDFLGIFDTKQAKFLDAIEHPPGKFRVLAGDKQYFRSAPNLEWQEVKGNRCARFVPVGDDLFCAFVVKGEEITTPERTDYTFGWFLLVPIVYWSHEHASKLVLAQETQNGWIVRAVVDPDTPMDADDDFMVGTDSLGNIHFLYFTSKGGGMFFVFAYGYSGGAGASAPEPELRYAQLSFNQLFSHLSDTQNQVSSKKSTSIQWMTLKGVNLTHKPFIKKDSNYNHAHIALRPLSRNFSINKVTGELNGLMFASACNLDDGEQQLPLMGLDQSWVAVSIRNEQWSPPCAIVTARDFPTPNYSWSSQFEKVMKIDSKGNKHLLLKGVEQGFWKARKYMNYLVEDNVKWSAPLTLGSSNILSYDSSLAVDDSGVAFATWVNEEGKFIGRWIKPRNEEIH